MLSLKPVPLMRHRQVWKPMCFIDLDATSLANGLGRDNISQGFSSTFIQFVESRFDTIHTL